ncbi:nuclear transport factor 2 family protein [Roseateles oligotrophus]|uniref:Nuclear transport factor 2 family protein n=1 Tax=Roseateles oligotrophus TaxID=1769250 RepID=A0ABT2YIC2_9BURK|nr:nuclear transport factor 2 family protein [Roseateles oligotrophus]MCV2369813.1 nuclear transport factor 2 family protein [Roseateles oligotrophus]
MRTKYCFKPLLPCLYVALSLLTSGGAIAAAAKADAATADPAAQYAALSSETRQLAERYLQAYLRKDWATLEPLMAEQIRFLDPTAKLVFGDVDQHGKPALLKYFHTVYPYIDTHEFKVGSSFVAGNKAVFIAETDWSFAHPGLPVVRSKAPIILTLTVEDGRVIEHTEMADLQSFLNQRQALKKP